MNPTTVTVKKAFAWGGGQQLAGTTTEIYVGSNMTQERFNELLEIGAISLGVDQDYLTEQAKEHSKENRENR